LLVVILLCLNLIYFKINLDNEVVGMITRKDLAAPIAETTLRLKIETSKKSIVLKGEQLKPKKRSGSLQPLVENDILSDAELRT